MIVDQQHLFIKALLAGDEKAYEQLIKQFHHKLKRLAASYVGQQAADDVMQEVWLAVVKSLPNFKGHASLQTWLYRIVVNTGISKFRQNKRSREVPVADLADESIQGFSFSEDGQWAHPPNLWHFDEPSEILQSEELLQQLQQCLQHLPKLQQQVLLLMDIEGIEQDEVCNILNISASNLRVTLHRARLALYKVVDNDSGLK